MTCFIPGCLYIVLFKILKNLLKILIKPIQCSKFVWQVVKTEKRRFKIIDPNLNYLDQNAIGQPAKFHV